MVTVTPGRHTGLGTELLKCDGRDMWLGYRTNGEDRYYVHLFWEDSRMNSPTPLGTIAADAAKVIAWYKSKPLYAGAIAGFLIGQAVYHFLKV